MKKKFQDNTYQHEADEFIKMVNALLLKETCLMLKLRS